MDASFRLGPVGHFGLAVADARASADWYVEMLCMREAFRGDGMVAVESDAVTIVLSEGTPSPQTIGHIAFRLRDMPMLRRAFDHLRARGVAVEDGPDAIGPEAPGSPNLGIWFRDLDGYRLELGVPGGAIADAAEAEALA